MRDDTEVTALTEKELFQHNFERQIISEEKPKLHSISQLGHFKGTIDS